MKKKNRSLYDLPSANKIRAEIIKAENEGIHKKPVDFLSEIGMLKAATGRLLDSFVPTVEELTK